MKPSRVPTQVVQPFSQDDIRCMLVILGEDSLRRHRNTAIIPTFLDTGLRLSELASIQLVHINFENGIIKVMGKGCKERFVRVGKATRQVVLRYLLQRNDKVPYIRISDHGESQSGQRASSPW